MTQDTSGPAATADTAIPPGTTSSSGAVEPTDAQRDEQASQLVDRYSMWAGAAGLIPIPFVDIAAVGGLQLQMLHKLSEIYGVPFSENRGKSIIASLAGSVLPASTATTTAVSVFKTFPGLGTAVSAITMSAVSAGATWIIGKVFVQHFASGGTLLDFNPPDYREFIKTQKEKWKARTAAAPSTTQTTGESQSPAGGGTNTSP